MRRPPSTVGGTSKFIQDGVITDINVTGNTTTTTTTPSPSTVSFVVDGGTICGTAPDLHGGTPTTNGDKASSSAPKPKPGPDCAGARWPRIRSRWARPPTPLSGNVPPATPSRVRAPTLETNATLDQQRVDRPRLRARSSTTLEHPSPTPAPSTSHPTRPLRPSTWTHSTTRPRDLQRRGQLSARQHLRTAYVRNDGTIGVAPGGLHHSAEPRASRTSRTGCWPSA